MPYFRSPEHEPVRAKKLNDAYALLLTKQPLDQQLTDIAALSYTGNAGRLLKVNPAGNGFELARTYTTATATAAYTETAMFGDLVVFCSGAFTIILPTAVGNTATLNFKVVATGPVVLDGAGTETIDGALTLSLALMASTRLRSDNANWWVI